MRMSLIMALMFSMLLLMNAEKVVAQQSAAPAASKFTIGSAYADGDWIPVQYTCGVPNGSSPPVQWSEPPQGTVSMALIFHDTDAAPDKGVMDATLWILWNIPASSPQISAGVQPDASPDGIQQGKNLRVINGYQPPCPPVGAKPHHYVFELYALDAKLDLKTGSSRADLLKAMEGHVIGKATHVGVFGQGIDEETWRWGTTKAP